MSESWGTTLEIGGKVIGLMAAIISAVGLGGIIQAIIQKRSRDRELEEERDDKLRKLDAEIRYRTTEINSEAARDIFKMMREMLELQRVQLTEQSEAHRQCQVNVAHLQEELAAARAEIDAMKAALAKHSISVGAAKTH